jgi:hypothetical protein
MSNGDDLAIQVADLILMPLAQHEPINPLDLCIEAFS